MTQNNAKKVTRETVLKIAHIASIEIREHEVDPLVHELQAALNYVSILEEAIQKHASSPEALSVKLINVMRADVPQEYDSKPILEQAPEHDENYFVVPIIIK